jgi:hypothetical protein
MTTILTNKYGKTTYSYPHTIEGIGIVEMNGTNETKQTHICKPNTNKTLYTLNAYWWDLDTINDPIGKNTKDIKEAFRNAW